LNLVLYMSFRIFAYSSNILKANFDLMDSLTASGTVRSSADFMDEHWASAIFLSRLTYRSDTQDILLNYRMTNSPAVSVVGNLIANLW
jgi:hypothetical protein